MHLSPERSFRCHRRRRWGGIFCKHSDTNSSFETNFGDNLVWKKNPIECHRNFFPNGDHESDLRGFHPCTEWQLVRSDKKVTENLWGWFLSLIREWNFGEKKSECFSIVFFLKWKILWHLKWRRLLRRSWIPRLLVRLGRSREVRNSSSVVG